MFFLFFFFLLLFFFSVCLFCFVLFQFIDDDAYNKGPKGLRGSRGRRLLGKVGDKGPNGEKRDPDDYWLSRNNPNIGTMDR